MQLSSCTISSSSIKLFVSGKKPKRWLCFALSNSAESNSLESETLKTLEWSSVCKQVSAFTSTTMGSSAATAARLTVGQTPQESQKLLDQTTAGRLVAQPLDFAGIDDLTEIVAVADSGQLLTIRELCTVGRTLRAARELFQNLKQLASDSKHPERASEELEIIRSERKRNLEILDTLLKEVSSKIFQAGGIDRPLITKRRSRMCVGIRASHRYLLPDGVVLNVSSSGATYFMEPKDAIDLDLAFARAAYAKWMNGVCPIFSSGNFEGSDSVEDDDNLTVNIDGIRHPLLLVSSLENFSDNPALRCGNDADIGNGNGAMTSKSISQGISDFPVPVDFKIREGTRVVVISGPNTGGKTASMKTLGLASLMSKAGMHLPAKNRPKLPWFDHILADIGDHQSLEQNLSTFSGHISRIRKILEVTSKQSLVLIDEIGSGTDPSEGVALSTSILQYLNNSRRGEECSISHYRRKDTD